MFAEKSTLLSLHQERQDFSFGREYPASGQARAWRNLYLPQQGNKVVSEEVLSITYT